MLAGYNGGKGLTSGVGVYRRLVFCVGDRAFSYSYRKLLMLCPVCIHGDLGLRLRVWIR